MVSITEVYNVGYKEGVKSERRKIEKSSSPEYCSSAFSIEEQVAAIQGQIDTIIVSHTFRHNGDLPIEYQREVDCLRAAIKTINEPHGRPPRRE
jgi:hypothetical protein